MAPPTLDEITEDVCPGGTHHKCLPYGDCYGFQDFCSSRNRAVNSCFPHNIAGDEDALLSWCQQQVAGNATLKSHPACKYACVDRFNITTLYQSLPSHNEDTSGYMWVIAGLAILLAVSVIVNIVLLLRQRRSRTRQTPTVEDAWPQDDVAGNNIQGSVNDKIEERAAPLPVDILETDRTLNQTPLDDTNVPSSFQVDPVQGRSRNTQNRAPINQNDLVQSRSTNTQNGVPMDQPPNAQGTRVITENEDSVDHFHNVQVRLANEIENGQVRYSPQHTASFASTSFRRHNGGTSEELAGLIPGNRTAESDQIISLGPAPTDHSINANPTIPEAAGRHPNGTNVTSFE